MKIEREAQAHFDPVVITLETQEEVDLIYHLANAAEARSFLDYLKNNVLSQTEHEWLVLKIKLYYLIAPYLKDC